MDEKEEQLNEEDDFDEQDNLLSALEAKFMLVEGVEEEEEIIEEDDISAPVAEGDTDIFYEKIQEIEQQKEQLEKQLTGVEESTKSYIQDLQEQIAAHLQNLQQKDQILQQKDQNLQAKDDEIKGVRAENAEIVQSTRKYVDDLKEALKEKIEEIKQKDAGIEQLRQQLAIASKSLQESIAAAGSGGAPAASTSPDPALMQKLSALESENASLKTQLNGISESTRQYVDDLNASLMQKTKEIEEKDKKIFEYEMELELLRTAE